MATAEFWKLIFVGWLPIFRIFFVGTLAYFSLLFTLRLYGPRTIAKTNIFDFIVNVAIGSVFGRILTAKEVALAEAVTAFALLCSLQYAVAVLRLRSRRFRWLVDDSPRLLFHKANFVERNMLRSQFTSADVHAAARGKGFVSMDDIEVVILEADGSLSVIAKTTASAKELIHP